MGARWLSPNIPICFFPLKVRSTLMRELEKPEDTEGSKLSPSHNRPAVCISYRMDEFQVKVRDAVSIKDDCDLRTTT